MDGMSRARFSSRLAAPASSTNGLNWATNSQLMAAPAWFDRPRFGRTRYSPAFKMTAQVMGGMYRLDFSAAGLFFLVFQAGISVPEAAFLAVSSGLPTAARACSPEEAAM